MRFLFICASVPDLLPHQSNKQHCSQSSLFQFQLLSMCLVSLQSQHELQDLIYSREPSLFMVFIASIQYLELDPLDVALHLVIFLHNESSYFCHLLVSGSYLGDHRSIDCLYSNLYSFQLSRHLRCLSDQDAHVKGCVRTFVRCCLILVHQEQHYSALPFMQICPFSEVISSLVVVHYFAWPSVHTYLQIMVIVKDLVAFVKDWVILSLLNYCSAKPFKHIFQHSRVIHEQKFLRCQQDRCYFILPSEHIYLLFMETHHTEKCL